VSNVNWLNETEYEAWKGLLAVMHRGFPEIERNLQTHGLLGVHYHILTTLSITDEMTMRLSDLADTANLSQSRLTHRMRTLVDSGDVEINKDPEDGRAKQATLTKKGYARLKKIAPDHVMTVRRIIFDHLSPTETKALAESLRPVVNSLVDHPEYLNPK